MERVVGEFELGGLGEVLSNRQKDSKPQLCLLRGRENYLSHHSEEVERLRERLEGTGKPLSNAEVERFRSRVRDEVRALLARWLRMENLCVLVGAGASVCCEGVLGRDLPEKIGQLLEGRESKKLYSALLDACGTEGLDFEEFLSYVCAVRRCLGGSDRSFREGFGVSLGSGPGATKLDASELDDLLGDVEAAIAVVCNLRLGRDDGSGAQRSPHGSFVGKLLARDPKLGRVKLATTNYDTLFEQAMDRLGVLYADGFIGTVERYFNPAGFNLDYYYPGEVATGRVRRYDKFLHLYKLHGSIRWRRSRVSEENLYGVTWCGKAMPTMAELGAGDASLEDVFRGHCELPSDGRVGLAILPTSAKYGETLTMPYSHFFRAFGEALQEPQTVCMVLGYSGWDRHINAMIRDALANPSFTLAIVDPEITTWARGLLDSDRCERVYSLSGEWGRFEEFVELLPDVEQLRTRLEVAKQLRQLSTDAAVGPVGEE